MKRVSFVTLLVCLLAADGATARASEYSARVADFTFTPRVISARAGDSVTWTWVSGTHDVFAYSGDTFDSGLRSSGDFTATFTGGTVLYRCRPHSYLRAGSPPVCSGMCGVIADEDDPLDAPTIGSPVDGEILASPVTLSGESAPGSVEVREGVRGLGRATVRADGTWSLSGVSFSSGDHRIRAVTIQGDRESALSNETAFVVDATPPSVSMDRPDHLSIHGESVAFSGRAADDRSVGIVGLAVRDRVRGDHREVPAMCDGCGSSAASWQVSANLEPGVYDVYAWATDGVGNRMATDPITIIVLV